MRRLACSLAAAALVLSACGGSSSSNADPKATLNGALEQLQGSEGMTAAVTVQSTPESLQALAAEGGNQLSAQDAQKILGSLLTVSSNNEQDPAKAAGQVIVNVAGADAVELRMVEGTLYVRAEVRSLLETFGQDPAMADQLVQQAAASGLDFVDPLIRGEWVALQGLQQALGQAGVESSPTGEQQKMVDELVRSLEESATVTSAGEEDEGTHLVVTVSLRDVVSDLRDATQGLAQGVPTDQALPAAEEVPDEDVRLDVWVSDGRLTQIEFDFLQLEDVADEEIPSEVTRLALRVELEEFSGQVEVPADAVPVDLQKLLQGAFGGMAAAAG